jgi:hypothetical protein
MKFLNKKQIYIAPDLRHFLFLYNLDSDFIKLQLRTNTTVVTVAIGIQRLRHLFSQEHRPTGQKKLPFPESEGAVNIILEQE